MIIICALGLPLLSSASDRAMRYLAKTRNLLALLGGTDFSRVGRLRALVESQKELERPNKNLVDTERRHYRTALLEYVQVS